MKFWRQRLSPDGQSSNAARRRCHEVEEATESGQSTVEFAIIVPLVVVVFLAIAQVLLLASIQLAISHVSREAARTLAVDPHADIGQSAPTASVLGQDGLSIESWIIPAQVDGRATVVVRVTHDAVVLSSIFHWFLADVMLSAETKMVLET